ncbi:MAG: 23S rRNA (adenine(2030)-N(6))-methyltransferase RlmJ [Thiotrichaceae bacterium]
MERILLVQLCVYPDDVELRLNGAGVAIINPPYQLDTEVSQILPLSEILAIENGSYTVKYLA